ncbi:MAG: YidH family protein [Leptolyngbya sp. BL-A-14]
MPKIDRQREHQANERTFLAWLRTAIALIGFGFAIARFGLFLRELQSALTHQDIVPPSFLSSQSIGVVLVVTGIVIIPLSVWRYNRVFSQIERSDYKPNRLLVWITAGIVTILGIISIPLMLWRQVPSMGSRQSRAMALPVNHNSSIAVPKRLKKLQKDRSNSSQFLG